MSGKAVFDMVSGDEMPDNDAPAQPGEFSGEMRGEFTAAEGARRAWARPRLYRISLQRTLAGSGLSTDVSKPTSALPT